MIETWSVGEADTHMAEEILVDLGNVIRRHPWWKARAGLTLALLKRLGVEPPSAVLDAGCGWGVTLEVLERAGYRATGLEVSRRTLELLDSPSRPLIEADLTKDLPAKLPAYDAVLALDVIEHLDDDRATVARLGRLVRPGGWLIVSVPALPELYTEFDRVQGHRRRYVPDTLRAAFEGSGLVVDRVFWWGAWMVPLLGRQRRSTKAVEGESPAEAYRRYLTLPPWPLPLVFQTAFVLEQGRALDGKLRTGTSLFAVARALVPSPSP